MNFNCRIKRTMRALDVGEVIQEGDLFWCDDEGCFWRVKHTAGLRFSGPVGDFYRLVERHGGPAE